MIDWFTIGPYRERLALVFIKWASNLTVHSCTSDYLISAKYQQERYLRYLRSANDSL